MIWCTHGAIDGSISSSNKNKQYDHQLVECLVGRPCYTIFKHFLESIRILLLLLSVHSIFFCYIIFIVSFPIDEFDHWTVVSYQCGYAVHDEVGGYITTGNRTMPRVMLNLYPEYIFFIKNQEQFSQCSCVILHKKAN